jgi:LPXTG-motif cell wall-anchored protein
MPKRFPFLALKSKEEEKMKKMKKISAVLISVILMLSVLPFAASAESSSAKTVQSQIEGARDYVFGNTKEFTFDKSGDFLLFLRAGGNYSKFSDAYLSSVKDAIINNKITDAAVYAAIMQCLQYGDNISPDSFELGNGTTVNLIDKMEQCSTVLASPYYYRIIFELNDLGLISQDFINQCRASLLKMYTLGKGMDYYGFACDNTANFIASLTKANLASDTTEDNGDLADALTLLISYKVEKGYFYNADYGKTPNADSTASALLAYSITGNKDNAKGAYELLMNFAVSGKTGVFNYSGSDDANAYATKDALCALEYYADTLDDDNPTTTDTSETTDTSSNDTTAASNKSTTQSTPSTGDSAPYIIFIGLALIGATGAVIGVSSKKKVD